MIGRESESRVLTQTLRRLRGRVACAVEGDPGIGKTTLLARAAIAARLGCLVLTATPEPAEAILPFTGLSDLCQPLDGKAHQRGDEHPFACVPNPFDGVNERRGRLPTPAVRIPSGRTHRRCLGALDASGWPVEGG